MIKKKINGLNVNIIPTNKFKTIYVSIKFSQPFDKNTINQRSILSSLMLSGTKKYPTKKRLEQRQDELYGLGIDSSVSKLGMENILSFDMTFLNPKYLSNENTLLSDALSFLNEILFSQRTRNQCFLQSKVKEEIRLLSDELSMIFHDKNEYSFNQFKEFMFSDEVFRFNPKGNLSSLSTLTAQDIYDSYQRMIHEDRVDLYILGDVNEEELVPFIEKYFLFSPRNHELMCYDLETSSRKVSSSKTVFDEVRQTRVYLGFRVPIRQNHPLYYPMILFQLLYGENDQSKLFQVVREKHQLSYYISSTYIANKGIVIVSAGSKKEDANRVIEESIRCLKEIQTGKFTIKQMNEAKKRYVSKLKKTLDGPGSLIAHYYIHDFYYQTLFDEDLIYQKIKMITKEQIVQAANQIILDTTFIDTSKGEDDE